MTEAYRRGFLLKCASANANGNYLLGFVGALHRHGIDPVKFAGAMQKEADSASDTFRTMQEQFSPANGFRLNARPDDAFGYNYSGPKTRDEIQKAYNDKGFGFHAPQVNDYGKPYNVQTPAYIMDGGGGKPKEVDARTQEDNKLLQKFMGKAAPTRQSAPPQPQSGYWQNRAARMFDRQGYVPTIAQNFGQQAYNSFTSQRNARASGTMSPEEAQDMENRAYSRVDTKGRYNNTPGEEWQHDWHYESLPKNVTQTDKDVLSAMHFASNNQIPIYGNTDRFMTSAGLGGREQAQGIADYTMVPLSRNELGFGDRPYYDSGDTSVHLPTEYKPEKAFHEFAHGIADGIGRRERDYNPADTAFLPVNLWNSPTIREEHGNADTLLGAGPAGSDLSGKWYYGNMMKNWYADQLHQDAPVTRVPRSVSRTGFSVSRPVPYRTLGGAKTGVEDGTYTVPLDGEALAAMFKDQD